MRTVGQFRSMTAEERAVEKVELAAKESEMAEARAALDKARASLDARLEVQYKELEKLNQQAEAADRALHDIRQDKAGLEAAEAQLDKEHVEHAAQASGEGVTSGVSVQ